MRVRDATGYGIGAGFVIGLIAFSSGIVTQQTQVDFIFSAWLIVVLTTIFPLISYLEEKQMTTGAVGGFLNGLGTGLGVFLLFTGRAI